MNKILILGSNSFSGNHLVNFLIEKDMKVIGCSLSAESPKRFNTVLNEGMKKRKNCRFLRNFLQDFFAIFSFSKIFKNFAKFFRFFLKNCKFFSICFPKLFQIFKVLVLIRLDWLISRIFSSLVSRRTFTTLLTKTNVSRRKLNGKKCSEN